MRLIRTFGLAAFAAVAAMAFVGVSSALAITELEEVVVCKALEDPCAVGNRLGAGTIIHSTAIGSPLLLSESGVHVTCTGSTTLGEIKDTLYAHGEITALGFTGCTNSSDGGACTATAENLNYLVKGELEPALPHENYELLVTEKAGNGRPEVKVVCSSIGLNCKYGKETVLLLQLHDTVHNDTIFDVLEKLSGLGLCAFLGPTTWHAEYLTKCLEASNLGTEIPCWLEMHH